MIMSGLECKIDKCSTWSKSHVSSLKRAIKKMQKTTEKPLILYRGAQVSPILEEISDDEAIQRFMKKVPIVNPSPISTSTSRNIAKEFIYRGGYIHVFHLDNGVKVLDLNKIQCINQQIMGAKQREREVIISPNQMFIPLRRYKDVFHWRVANII